MNPSSLIKDIIEKIRVWFKNFLTKKKNINKNNKNLLNKEKSEKLKKYN